jgi:CBS-domain-containing membrane protein
MLVEEVMSRQAKCCRASDSLAAAARLMWEHDIGAVPVLGSDGKLAGIITDRDICMAAYIANDPLTAMHVAEHMSHRVSTVEPAATVEAAEALMAEKQVRRLPVVGFAGEIVGMVTMGDLARAAVEMRRKDVDARALAATFSRIVKARRNDVITA